MRITERHIRFAKLTLEGDLTASEIAVQCGISDRQGRNWRRHPKMEQLMDSIARTALSHSRLALSRHAVSAAKTLVAMLETREVKRNGETQEVFVYPPNIARKAACDILKWAGINIKGEQQVPVSTVVVYKGIIANSDIERRVLKSTKRARSTERQCPGDQK
jgi:hypothetical protein